MTTGTIGTTAVNTVAIMTEAMTNVMVEGMTVITTVVMIAVVTAIGTGTTGTTIDTGSCLQSAGHRRSDLPLLCEAQPWEF
jgi:hypothetical protein